MSTRPLLAMTGAAGKLGTLLRPALAEAGWTVRLSDLRCPKPLLANETFVRGRLDRQRHMQRVCQGAGVLIHLGAASNEQDWAAVIHGNVTGLVTTLEAARAAGVGHVVLASTMHVLGMHRRNTPIDEGTPFAPDSRYAATKLFGEGVARLFAEKYGLAVTVLRIGQVVDDLADASPGEGIAAADLVPLVRRVLEGEPSGFRLYHAVAPHPGYPTTDGRLEVELGFAFREHGPDVTSIMAQVAAAEAPNDRVRDFRGGDFAGYD